MKSLITKALKAGFIAAIVIAGFVSVFQGSSTPSANACATGACPTELLGTCYPNKETINVGEAVTWTAVASGGTGSYTYNWAGDEGKSGTGSVLTTSYSSAGTKNIIASITSGAYTIRRQCHVVVVAVQSNPLTVDCTANPSQVDVGGTVTYSVTATGGNGNYTYSWSGTDGLSGNNQSVSKSYSTSGTKTAFATVNSGNESRTATCSSVVRQVQVPQLNLSCVSNPSQANVNDTVTYSATATGGDGNYNYSWTGTDGLSSNSQSASRQYSTSGTKTATVTVTSGNMTRTASCSAFINQQQNNQIYASCVANPSYANVGDNVAWTVQNVSGGNGNYTYSWSGSDNLYGNSQTVYKSYSFSGTKNATVTVYSNGQSTTAYCSMNVNGNNNNQNLTAYCYGTPNNASINTNVNWYGSASGGNGNYYYSWTGSDNLYGYSQNIYKTYNFAGSKNAVLTVTSNGQTAQANCYINVGNNSTVVLTQNPNGQLSSGVFLSQVPYTGGGLNLKVSLFILGLFMFSAFGAYMIIQKRNSAFAAAGGISQKEMIARFKADNQARKI
jgi:hypothetical protein